MTNTLVEQVLKPCPFCGGKGLSHRVPTGWRVSCKSCGCQPRSGLPADTEVDAVVTWNTRLEATRTNQLDLVEVLKDVRLYVGGFDHDGDFVKLVFGSRTSREEFQKALIAALSLYSSSGVTTEGGRPFGQPAGHEPSPKGLGPSGDHQAQGEG